MEKKAFTHIHRDGTKIMVTNLGSKRVSYITEMGVKCQVGYDWFRANISRINTEAK